MEEGISSESTSKRDMEKEDAKPCKWVIFCERWFSSESVSLVGIVGIDANAKNDVCSVTLWVGSW